VKIARTADFILTKIKSYTLLGKKVAILRLDNGTYMAIEASCKHQGADLTTGELRGTVVTCPRHQWMYDLISGQCLNHDSLPLRKYGLQVEGENILVSLRPLEE